MKTPYQLDYGVFDTLRVEITLNNAISNVSLFYYMNFTSLNT